MEVVELLLNFLLALKNGSKKFLSWKLLSWSFHGYRATIKVPSSSGEVFNGSTMVLKTSMKLSALSLKVKM